MVENGEIIAIAGVQIIVAEIPGLPKSLSRIHRWCYCRDLLIVTRRICYDGSRNRDYAVRIAGKSYLEIARAGGGIWDSVTKTRIADLVTLTENTVARANRHLKEGVTTMEVKVVAA